MDFLIITGLSGAGKSRAADVMEDLDYYCVDNMPVALMPRFAELCIATGGRYENVALVTDVREKNGFGELLKTIDQLKEMNCSVRILYMDADVRTIVRRYKESRRPHPLATRGTSIEEAGAPCPGEAARGLHRQQLESHPQYAPEQALLALRPKWGKARDRRDRHVLRL